MTLEDLFNSINPNHQFNDIVRKLENKLYTQWILPLIVQTLRQFSDTSHYKLSAREIAEYIKGFFPNYGDTPRKRAKLEECIRKVEDDSTLDDVQKRKRVQKLEKEYTNRINNSLKRTVKNRLDNYCNNSMIIRQLGEYAFRMGEDYYDDVISLLFAENEMNMLNSGFIRKEYSEEKKCDVYWFEGIIDPPALECLISLINGASALSYMDKDYLINAVTMTMLPSEGIQRFPDFFEKRLDVSSFDKEALEMRTGTELAEAREYALSWDDYAGFKLNLAREYKSAA